MSNHLFELPRASLRIVVAILLGSGPAVSQSVQNGICLAFNDAPTSGWVQVVNCGYPLSITLVPPTTLLVTEVEIYAQSIGSTFQVNVRDTLTGTFVATGGAGPITSVPSWVPLTLF